jgi:hypothetical protein
MLIALKRYESVQTNPYRCWSPKWIERKKTGYEPVFFREQQVLII